jgi:hypothetical protein
MLKIVLVVVVTALLAFAAGVWTKSTVLAQPGIPRDAFALGNAFEGESTGSADPARRRL